MRKSNWDKPVNIITAISLIALLALWSVQPVQAQRKPQGNIDAGLREAGVDPATAQLIKSVVSPNVTPSMPRPPQELGNFFKAAHARVAPTTQPPANFPAPVFQASDARYTVRQNLPLSMSGVNLMMNVLSITTGQPASVVASWYKKALEQSGWKIITAQKRPPITLPARYTEPISAQKDNLECMVVFTEWPDQRKTQVNVNVSSH